MLSVQLTSKNSIRNLKKKQKERMDLFAQTFYEEVKRATPIDKGKARRGWNLYRKDRVWHVNNRVPYINVLEEGHSKQAPNGMIQPAIRQTLRRIKK
jgi:hypothetical protein